MEEIYYFEDWVNNMLNDSDYTEFELEKDVNILTLDLPNITLMELFNYVKLNTNVPFVSLNNFEPIVYFSKTFQWYWHRTLLLSV